MPKGKYFSYCPEMGFEFHTTEQEALSRAENLVEYHRDEARAGGEWLEPEVEYICHGKAAGMAAVIHEEKAPESVPHTHNRDYGLVDADELH